MMWSDVVVLAVVQGLTEFLPVSSSGHLVVARVLFGIPDVKGNAFDAFLHLGTLAAVLVYYWRVWWGMLRGIMVRDKEGQDKRELAAKLAIATVPAAVVGYAGWEWVEEVFRQPTVVATGLLGTAIVLAAVDLAARQIKTVPRASFRDAAIIGLAQVVALLPGISRSGVTIAAGRWQGLTRRQAASFSFLLSAPIIAGAGLTSLGSLIGGGGYSMSMLLLGLVVSFVAGLAAIFFLLKVIERVSFVPFAVYLLLVAGVLWYAQ